MGLFSRRPLTPEELKIYKQTRQAETRKIEHKRHEARVKAIREKARADAARAATPTSSKIVGGLISAGKQMSKHIEKFDEKKLEAFVTGKKK